MKFKDKTGYIWKNKAQYYKYLAYDMRKTKKQRDHYMKKYKSCMKKN